MFTLIVLLLALCHISEGTYVVSWGDNQYGQLGLGHLTSVFAATQVTAYDGVNVARIRIGLSTHFVMASDGSVYCGGNNAFGQLGIGSSVSQEASPIRNSFAFGLDSYPIGPQTIGYNASTKDVYGWGFEAGYMVPSFTGNALTPRKSTSPDFAGIAVGVATGWSASFVFLNGGAYAAGKVRNYGGYTPDSVAKLGINVTSAPADFVRMSFWNNVPMQYLFDSGSSHVCAIAKNQSLYCWGKNTRGQLGLGDNTDRALPSYVPFVDQDDVYVARVVTGDAHTVLLTCGGKVYTWGSNARGNLGLGSKDSYVHATPTLLESISSIKIVEIASGFNTVFARNSTNHWYVWGSNDMNMTLYGTGDVLSPSLNPTFRETGLTHIAANSKSNFAFAWVDPNPWSHISECPPLVDECRLGMASCAPNTKCVDTERSYKCICGSGFQGDGRSIESGGTGCEDINECLTDICGSQAICENQLGSFACVCPDGFTSEGLVIGSNCTDIDECSEGGYCPPNTDCINTIGSFNCSCTAGFRQIGTSACGPICTDIDECNTLTNPCGANTVCNNFDGSFNCSCIKGFSGPSCADINECITGGHNCATQSFCTNLPGTFTCKCPNGFEGDGVSTLSGGVGCLDINECVNSPCHPNATCANSVGSFGCTCNSGFSGNGRDCIDNDECASTNDCVTLANNGICTNTEGGYLCSCEIGYYGNGIRTSISGGTGCSDIDECLGSNNCDPVANCFNTHGNYSCSCPLGYKGSGNKCYTVNCAAGQYPVTATTCAACPAGTYNGQTDVEKCAPCPAGTYSAGVGKTSQSTCLSCPKNTYSNLGSSSCTTCPLGSVSVAGSGECSPCPAGQYGTQGSCKSCGAGWFSSPGSAECQPCPPGTFSSSSSSSSCDVCPAGTFSKGRAAACTTCGAGRYSEAGQYYCKQCAPGTSTLGASGAASCTPCPAGSFANLAGSGQCSVCSAGTYSYVNGSDSCTACIPGTYQNDAGQTSCKICDNWRYSDVSAAVTCATCYQGYAAEKEYGSTSCFACPPGMYRTNGDTVCLPCHAGSASEKAGIPHCSLCMGGFYQPRCGRTTCEVCDLNSYSLYRGAGSTKCNYCPFGQESFGTAYFCFGE